LAVRVAPCVLLIVLCLSPAGCKSLGKKDSATASGKGGNDASLARGSDRGAPAGPAAPAQPPYDAQPVAGGGVLAGQVLDPYNHRLPNAYIQVTEAGEVSRRAAPIEIAADREGYFLIPGLQIGRRYQLAVRAQDAGRTMTGSVWATPPD